MQASAAIGHDALVNEQIDDTIATNVCPKDGGIDEKIDELVAMGSRDVTGHGSKSNISPACLESILVHLKHRCLILNLNGLLLKRYRITYNRERGSRWVSDDIAKIYNVITPPKLARHAHFQYVVRLDA